MKEIYNQRRKYLLGRLEKAGIRCQAEPAGAFYMLANVKKYTRDSYSFAFKILQEAGVAVAPGIDFGPNCEGYLRISYANSLAKIEEEPFGYLTSVGIGKQLHRLSKGSI